ncbi:response regulator transcription factor [Sphingobacterium sp. LRF_L2]|uniref:response regulator transcription factor n=1 Tax=Sphingobacterium sp. LRF_L2 TaxID=3369421 RepID=UPI003F5DB6A5
MESKGTTETLKKPYAGMIDKAADFFKEGGKLYLSYGGCTKEWPDFDPRIMEIVQNDMLHYPEALKALASWENLLPEMYEYRYIACRFGGLDDEPDIDENGIVHPSEYVPCKLRGECKYEGKLCQAIKVANGVISKREMDVLRLIREDNKIIADRLNISTETVNSHIINIREKIGKDVDSKPKMAIWAGKKGII